MDVQVEQQNICLNYLSSFSSIYDDAFISYQESLIKKDIWKNLEKSKMYYQYTKCFSEEQLKKYCEWEQRAKRVYYDQEEQTILLIRKIVNKLTAAEYKEIERYILSNDIFKDAIKKKTILISDSENIICARFIYMIYMMKSGKAITFRSARTNNK